MAIGAPDEDDNRQVVHEAAIAGFALANGRFQLFASRQVHNHAEHAVAFVRKVDDRAGAQQPFRAAFRRSYAKLEYVVSLPVVQPAPDLSLEVVAVVPVDQRSPVPWIVLGAIDSEKHP